MILNRYILLIFLFVSGAVLAHGDKEEKEDSKMVNVETDIGEAVAKLHSALQSGDESTIKSIMHETVLIFEGSGAERSLEEYASHHMKSDIKFLKSMAVKLLERNILIEGNVAVSSSRSKIKGTYKGKSFEKITVETLTLKKIDGIWKVIRVHWS